MIRIHEHWLWLLLGIFAVCGYMAGRLFRHAYVTRLQNRLFRCEGALRKARTDRDRAQEELHYTRDQLEADNKQLRRDLAAAVGHSSALGKLLPFPARNDDWWSAS